MVICDSRKFTFIRIPKNASTSLATYFINAYCNTNDVYTGIGDAKIPTNNVSSQIIDRYKHSYQFIHLTLNQIIGNKIFPEERIRTHRIIGVIREPLDRQLSLFFFKCRKKGGQATPANFREMFSRGFCSGDVNNEHLQSDYLKIGNQQVGEYWRYNDLQQHLDLFKAQIKPQRAVSLPNYKSSMRKSLDKERLIDEYYDQKTFDSVKRYYEKDFELWEKLTGR